MKRAALLTAGLLTIGFVLLSLNAVMNVQQNLFERHAVQLTQMHRMNALFESTADSIATVFEATTDLSITTTDDYIAFTEEFPHQEFMEFDALESFIESNSETVTLDDTAISTLQLAPHNLQYIHAAEDQIEVRADSLPGTKYVVTIALNRPIVSCDYSEDEGEFELEVVATGTENTDCSSVRLVDPDGVAEFNIVTANDSVTVQLSDADLFVTGTGMTATTELWYGKTDEARELRLGEDTLIQVSIPHLAISRTGNALLRTW